MRDKVKVLFVCIGNSCRSPMAEGFARHYGDDVLFAASAGVSPASIVQPLTKKVMKDRGIDISDLYPKSVYEVQGGPFQIIVNISGFPLPRDFGPAPGGSVLEWRVHDPIGETEVIYKQVAEQLSSLVMQLVLKLRGSNPSAARDSAPTPRRSRLWRESGRTD
jgi:arsenate reductase